MKTRIIPPVLLAIMLAWSASPPQSHANDLLAASFPGDVIVRYDGTTGAHLGTFASHPSMDGPTAMVYGADGNLYVLSEFSRNVLRFNGATGAFIDEFISKATFDAVGVPDPGDMELGPDGNLYISSHFPADGPLFTAVWKFSGSTPNDFIAPFASFGAVSHTHGLSFGPGGKLYLGDLGLITGVREFDAITGAYLGASALTPTGALLFGDITFTPDGKLYATSDGNGGVVVYDPITTTTTPLIAPGPGESYWGILADSGYLYVANKSTGTVKKYTDSGVFVSDFITGFYAPFAFDMIPMAAPTPEPGTALLLLSGLAAVGLRRVRRR